jgi:hypothetical protein
MSIFLFPYVIFTAGMTAFRGRGKGRPSLNRSPRTESVVSFPPQVDYKLLEECYVLLDVDEVCSLKKVKCVINETYYRSSAWMLL